MGRRSRVKELPPEILERVNGALRAGKTLDEIVEALDALGVEDAPSRSALGRYKQEIDQVGERLRRSREISNAFVEKLGAVPEGKQGRLIMELMQTVVFDLLINQDEGGQGDFNPQEIMFLAKSIKDLASAEKLSADRELKIRKELADKAGKAIDKVERELADGDGGDGQPDLKDALKRIREEVYGIFDR